MAEPDTNPDLEALADAVEQRPNDASARLRYGLALQAIGATDDAAYQLLQADKVAKDDPAILRALGTVFYDKGLHDKAARFLGRATKIDPEDARAWYALGVVHDARRDTGASIAALREAIRIDPQHLDARRTLIDALAGIGEHAQAIDAIDALLAVHARDEQAAKNREVLEQALQHLTTHRLLGKHAEDVEKSALVHEGAMKQKGTMPDGAVRFAGKLVDLYVVYDSGAPPHVAQTMLVLPDPDRAAKARDDRYGVTVVGKDGRRGPTDLATAATLTFLRESLGVPLTQAGVFYSRLLGGEARIEYAGAVARFGTRAHGTKAGDEIPGLICELLATSTVVG
jgi:tetratricopeptide (TPR) repeat protein